MSAAILSIPEWHRRFSLQASWTEEIRRYLLKYMLPNVQMRILEAGSGTGAVLSNFLRENWVFHGLDLREDFLQFSRQQSAPAAFHTAGNIYHAPYADNSFDLVYCHYLLLWLKDPVAALREIVRISTDRAWLLVFAEPDYGGRIDAPPPLDQLGQAQTHSLAAQGADPFIGRKLPGYCSQVREIEIEEYGILTPAPQPQYDPDFWESEWEMIASDLSGIADNKLDRYKAIDQQSRQTGERVLFIPTFYLSARIKKTGETP